MADKGVMAAIAAAKAAKHGNTTGKAPAPLKVTAVLPLESILDRPGEDTRPLNPNHIEELGQSIAAVGLIQPLAVDRNGCLLAGGHRRAALLQLQQSDPDKFAELFPSGIPVHAIDIDARKEQDQAIVIEAAENEKRRDYTPEEVRALADRLIEVGYRNKRGKPKKGEKALTPALMTIVGKSARTVERYLAGPKKTAKTDKPPHDGISKEAKARKKLVRMLEAFELSDSSSQAEVEAAAVLRGLLIGDDD